MAAFDDFARQLLEESKRFLEIAKGAMGEAKPAFLHAALNLGFCALEAHVNAIADDFLTTRKDLMIQDQAILAERDIRLIDGQYVLEDRLKMFRLEDRIQFLHRRFSGQPLDRKASWWSALTAASGLRNVLTHPKDVPNITYDAVSQALTAIVQCVEVLYMAIYKVSYPASAMGLQSKLSF